MANYLAVSLDRAGSGEMSCIAGVGGHVKKIVKVAQSGRKVIAIDGCPLACVKACLDNYQIVPDMHIELTKLGVSKKQHEDFDSRQANEILKKLQQVISETFAEMPKPGKCLTNCPVEGTFMTTSAGRQI
jgi:uncharacterized metal-binding protein